MNKVVGLCLTEALDLSALAEIEALFAAEDEPVRIELATCALPEAGRVLTERGYVLHGFENILGKRLEGALAAEPEVECARDTEAWNRVICDGFAAPDASGLVVDALSREQIDLVMRDALQVDYDRYLRRIDGVPAGAASMRIESGVALLSGASTLPEFRRRGVQGSLLNARLRDAHSRGAELAVMTTEVGSQSQANAMKRGFSLLYARAILVKAR
jgi:GNAT superfamily N-acetyltransferase